MRRAPLGLSKCDPSAGVRTRAWEERGFRPTQGLILTRYGTSCAGLEPVTSPRLPVLIYEVENKAEGSKRGRRWAACCDIKSKGLLRKTEPRNGGWAAET